MPEANRLTIGMMACLADYEAQLISERTKAALAIAKERGTVLGNPRLNEVRNTNTAAANQARAVKSVEYGHNIKEVISEIENEYGELSSRKIADKLNEAGYLTARGKPFSHVAVIRAKAL
jgi:DNA invertase Pin-like site-specific DNA recombinase